MEEICTVRLKSVADPAIRSGGAPPKKIKISMVNWGFLGGFGALNLKSLLLLNHWTGETHL